MKVYISGRITGLSYNDAKRNFAAGAEEVARMGHEPVSPLENGLPFSASWREHMVKDIAILMGCDAIFMLHDWKESMGARIEKHIAGEMKLKVFFQTGNSISDQKLNKIKSAIKAATGLAFEEYIAKSKKRELLFPRMIFVQHVINTGEVGPSHVARMINRDDAAIYHYQKVYPDEIRFNSEFRRMVEDVEKHLSKCVSV